MVTLFHILPIMLVAAGAGMGAGVGHHGSGVSGPVLGGAVGAMGGWLAWRLLSAVMSRLIPPTPTHELRAKIHSQYSTEVCSALMELKRRGEDVSEGIPVVRELLLADAQYDRSIGSLILSRVYPDLAEHLGRFRPADTSSESRERVRSLPWPDTTSATQNEPTDLA